MQKIIPVLDVTKKQPKACNAATKVLNGCPAIKLANTSKMPCPSFSLPAQACKVGSKLAKVPGSVCHGCYALKGMYRFPNVKAPRQANLESLPNDTDASGWSVWIDSMVATIAKSSAAKVGYFRWHDSGDLQGAGHLSAIATIATLLPAIKFWLPTKEKALVKAYSRVQCGFPSNLAVRLSSAMIDQEPTQWGGLTCTVHDKNEPIGHRCNAPAQGGKCGDCRACWDTSIANVSYHLH